VADEWLRKTTRPVKVAQIDPTVPNVARVWNYLVGGRDNFEADRSAARQLVAASPVMAQVGPASRAFLRRTVRYLTAEAGIRQFLDIGTGLPTAGNTHDVAQGIAPEARIVYVDNDPVVLAHARALLTSTPGGATSYIDADARDPARIIAEAGKTLDFGAPVAVVMIDILNFIVGSAEVTRILAALRAAVVPGSYLVIMQPACDLEPALDAAQRFWNDVSPVPVVLRARAEVTAWAAGLDLVPPGVVPVCEWRPGDGDPVLSMAIPLHGFAARKPAARKPAARKAGAGKPAARKP
jgi:hypothetical protein